MSYKQRLEKFLNNKYYMLSVVIIAVISFGFAVTHVTVDIDSLEGDRYLGEGNIMLSAGRFGMNFWAKLFGNGLCDPYHAYTIDIIAVILLVTAAIQFCILFQRVSGNQFTMLGCILFSCLFISYPLINEIWEYTGANLCVCGGYLLVGFSVYFIYDVIHIREMNHKLKTVYIIAALFCTTIICSSYESLAAVYVMTVFAVLFIESVYSSKSDISLKKLITEGLFYAIVLIGGIVMRVLIHRIILAVFNLPAAANGATEIVWGTEPLKTTVSFMIRLVRYLVVTQAFWYFPIAVLLFSILLFACFVIISSIKNRDCRRLLMAAGIFLSLFLIAIIQGTASPNRICQTYAFFAAFTIVIVFSHISEKRKVLGKVIAVALAILCVHQATYLSNIAEVNFARSEYEANVVRTIGHDLKQTDNDKKVIFVGEISIPEYIMDQVTADEDELKVYNFIRRAMGKENATDKKTVDTNVNSVINWSKIAFNNDGKSMEKLFAYYGYIIQVESDSDILKEAEAYAEKYISCGYPCAGYIIEYNDYIMVNLGRAEQK